MKQVNFKFIDMLKKFKSGVVLTFLMAFFSIAMLSNASAQSHPIVPGFDASLMDFANKLGIDVTPADTWHRGAVINTFEKKLKSLDLENQTELDLFETKYYYEVIKVVSNLTEAPEVATVKTLQQLFSGFNSTEYSNEFMITYMNELYKSSVSEL